MSADHNLSLIATTAFGLEKVVARELQQLGYTEQQVENGRVRFSGDAAAICRANLWLRSADRVLVEVGDFPCTDFGELFDQTAALPWEQWLEADSQFPVRGRSVRSTLASVPDCQRLVKKAIATRLQRIYDQDWCPETGPEYTIEIAVVNDRALLTIDTSGARSAQARLPHPGGGGTAAGDTRRGTGPAELLEPGATVRRSVLRKRNDSH